MARSRSPASRISSGGRHAPALSTLAVIVVFQMAVSCAPPDTAVDTEQGGTTLETASPELPPYDDVAVDLTACPRGDERWRDAIGSASAEDRLSELLALSRKLTTSCPERWEPAWTAGECLLRLGSEGPDALREAFDEALSRAARLGDSTGLACAVNRIGALDFWQGDSRSAARRFDEAINAAVKAGRRDLEAYARNNLAGALVEIGDFGGARDEILTARIAFDELEMREPARWATANGAVVLIEMGNAVGARETLEEIRSSTRDGDDPTIADMAALLLGNLSLSQGLGAVARGWYDAVGESDVELSALARHNRARSALRYGDVDGARRMFIDAIDLSGEAHRRIGLTAEAYLAEAERLAGESIQARARLERVIAESDASGMGHAAWTARWLLGRLMLAEGQVPAARELLEAATARITAQRAALDPLGSGMTFLRERADPYVDLALAIARFSPEAQTRRTLSSDEADAILAISRESKARALRHVFSGDAAAPLGASRARDIRESLEEGDLLVDLMLGEDSGIAIAFSRDAVRAAPLAGRRALAPLLESFRGQLSTRTNSVGAARAELIDAGRRIRAALLDPVAGSLQGVTRLLIVPDRETALIPFAALPLEDDGASAAGPPRFLGDVVETAMTPMAAPLPMRGEPPRKRAPLLLAGMPRPDDRGRFPELPWASFELSRIRRTWGAEDTTLLTGERFTEGSLRDQSLSRYGTIHLATHAVASSLDPRRCGVVLDRGELFGIDDVSRLELGSPLVVLSACRTGEGEIVPGEGVIGLGWAFLRAGASAIVVSHWSVDDAGSARIMVSFHERLRAGDDPVRALAIAQRELARTSPDPSLWAPFVVLLRPQFEADNGSAR